MSKPWLETWKATLTKRGGELDKLRPGRKDGIALFECGDLKVCAQYASFAAGAPEMCRALLDVEWSAKPRMAMAWCPCCLGETPAHDNACRIDSALTKAGLPDQASRDAARRELGL